MCVCVYVSPAVVTQEIELLAGGGLCVPMGEMCRMLLTRQDWFGTMFPLLPVNVQKVIEDKLRTSGDRRSIVYYTFLLCTCLIKKELEFHRTHITLLCTQNALSEARTAACAVITALHTLSISRR